MQLTVGVPIFGPEQVSIKEQRSTQRAPDEWNRVRKPLKPTKANDKTVDSLAWFKSYCNTLDAGAKTGGKTPALALA